MKGLVLAWLLVCALGQVHAQPAESGGGPDINVQQRRLDTLRHDIAQQAHEEDRACHERFAVNDCLKAARARNLEKTADIRRQQERLNDFQRRQRGAEKIRHQEDMTAQHEQGLRDAAARSDLRAESGHEGKNGDLRHPVRGTAGGNPPAGVAERAAVRLQPPTQVDRQEYQRKLQDAEKRRQERDKRLRERANSKPPAPLPAAP